jgi:5-methylcytosine-specific restriction endonuclease McrA
MNNKELAAWINTLIQEDKLYKFYKSRAWLELRASVMDQYHNECYNCRKKGKITQAQTVHHVNHVKDRPDLALTQYIITEQGEKKANLIPLCNACHNLEHLEEKAYKAYFNKKKNKDDEPEERWD